MKLETTDYTRKSRRGFTKSIGVAGAGIAAFLADLQPATAQSSSTLTSSDIAILQFALNLEYLEAEFYTMALTGQTISQAGLTVTGSGSAGATTGGQKVTFITGSSLLNSVTQIAADERAHVALLQSTLTGAGVTPIAKPAINLNALGTGFQSQEAFIALARSFEDVGVSAYAGAAPMIQSTTVLGYAARILAAEAEHTANLRLHASLYQAPTTAVDSQDILPPPTGMQYISTNSQGLVAVRTPGEVLAVVFGGNTHATSGGFFPAGVNGALNSSST
jgi:hypothetical protein